jgi:hypothetical protein
LQILTLFIACKELLLRYLTVYLGEFGNFEELGDKPWIALMTHKEV